MRHKDQPKPKAIDLDAAFDAAEKAIGGDPFDKGDPKAVRDECKKCGAPVGPGYQTHGVTKSGVHWQGMKHDCPFCGPISFRQVRQVGTTPEGQAFVDAWNKLDEELHKAIDAQAKAGKMGKYATPNVCTNGALAPKRRRRRRIRRRRTQP